MATILLSLKRAILSIKSGNLVSYRCPKKNKGYDINFKIEVVEYAEKNSNEKAAKKFRVRLFIHQLLFSVGNVDWHCWLARYNFC